MVVAALYSFLVDRFQAADFAGTLTINLLTVSLVIQFDLPDFSANASSSLHASLP
jgi:hypothetical protein